VASGRFRRTKPTCGHELSKQAKARALEEAIRVKAAEVKALEEARAAQVANRTFDARVIPDSAFASKVGSLETPTFAEVVSLEEKTAKAARKNIDSETIAEILRRRRSNG
jgi:hypothetical protein